MPAFYRDQSDRRRYEAGWEKAFGQTMPQEDDHRVCPRCRKPGDRHRYPFLLGEKFRWPYGCSLCDIRWDEAGSIRVGVRG